MRQRALARRGPEYGFAVCMVALGAACCFFGAFEIGAAVALFSALSVLIEPA